MRRNDAVADRRFLSAWSSDGALIADRVGLAATFGARLLGLLGRRRLSPGEGLLITPCRSVHSFFMRFPIDVVHLDEGLRVVACYTLAPNRAGPYVARSRHVLELPAGACRAVGLAAGRSLVLRDADGEPLELGGRRRARSPLPWRRARARPPSA